MAMGVGQRTWFRLRSGAKAMSAGGAGMGARQRRRLDLILLVIGVAVVAAAAAIGAAIGDTERIGAMWAGADANTSGAAQVVEVIDYDFGAQSRHGIIRDIPGVSPETISVVSATAPDEVQVSQLSTQTRLRIGDPARTVTGRHRYTITYVLGGVIEQDRLAWDAVGTGWQVGMSNVEVHVVAPFELEQISCVRGAVDSENPCEIAQPEPGHLVAQVDSLDAGHGITIFAGIGRRLGAAPALPAPPSGPPDDPGSGLLVPGLLAAGAALVGAAGTSLLIRRAGRERVAAGGATEAAWGGDGTAPPELRPQPSSRPEIRLDSEALASLATIEFVPPRELTPAQGGVVLTEGVQDEHKVAWLIGAAVDGYLELDGDGEQLELVRLPRRDGTAALALDMAFGGRDRLRLGEYDPSFAAAWNAIGKELSAWQRGSTLWDPAGDRRRTGARVLGAVVAVAGLLLTALGGALANRWGSGWLPIVAVGAFFAGAGFAAVIRAWELRVRTVAGSGLWLRVESFRRFLAESEARHADEAAKRGVLREYTAWAVAVGEVDRWSRAVAGSAAAPADPDALRFATIAPSLSTAAAASTIKPSSSNGDGWGGGGGGGVGGGAGGGGGGSW
jgi:hypothetical protein